MHAQGVCLTPLLFSTPFPQSEEGFGRWSSLYYLGRCTLPPPPAVAVDASASPITNAARTMVAMITAILVFDFGVITLRIMVYRFVDPGIRAVLFLPDA